MLLKEAGSSEGPAGGCSAVFAIRTVTSRVNSAAGLNTFMTNDDKLPLKTLIGTWQAA